MNTTTEIKERPILFSTPMVQAILEGRKTMTRRIVKSDANRIQWMPIVLNGYGGFCDEHGNPVKCKYEIGDTLWVRETWCKLEKNHVIDSEYAYKADSGTDDSYRQDYIKAGYPYQWKPSIFMPREACRLLLRITDIAVERLQDMTQEDAMAEGVYTAPHRPVDCGKPPYKNGSITRDCHVCDFQTLWNRLNGERGFSWNVNPWVWVITFEKL